MRICQNCGFGNPDDARFCRQCGRNMVQQMRQQNVSNGGVRQPDPRSRRTTQSGRPAQRQQYQQHKQTRRSGRKKRRESANTGLTVVMCLVGALLAVLIIGAAILIAVHLAG